MELIMECSLSGSPGAACHAPIERPDVHPSGRPWGCPWGAGAVFRLKILFFLIFYQFSRKIPLN